VGQVFDLPITPSALGERLDQCVCVQRSSYPPGSLPSTPGGPSVPAHGGWTCPARTDKQSRKKHPDMHYKCSIMYATFVMHETHTRRRCGCAGSVPVVMRASSPRSTRSRSGGRSVSAVHAVGKSRDLARLGPPRRAGSRSPRRWPPPTRTQRRTPHRMIMRTTIITPTWLIHPCQSARRPLRDAACAGDAGLLLCITERRPEGQDVPTSRCTYHAIKEGYG
jgi:hypothetical protein